MFLAVLHETVQSADKRLVVHVFQPLLSLAKALLSIGRPGHLPKLAAAGHRLGYMYVLTDVQYLSLLHRTTCSSAYFPYFQRQETPANKRNLQWI